MTKYSQHGNVRYADGARVWESRDPTSRTVKYARDKFHINRQRRDHCTTAQHIAYKSIVQQTKWLFEKREPELTETRTRGGSRQWQLEIHNVVSLEALFNVIRRKIRRHADHVRTSWPNHWAIKIFKIGERIRRQLMRQLHLCQWGPKLYSSKRSTSPPADWIRTSRYRITSHKNRRD